MNVNLRIRSELERLADGRSIAPGDLERVAATLKVDRDEVQRVALDDLKLQLSADPAARNIRSTGERPNAQVVAAGFGTAVDSPRAPEWFDLASMKVVFGGRVGNDKQSAYWALLTDQHENQLTLHFPEFFDFETKASATFIDAKAKRGTLGIQIATGVSVPKGGVQIPLNPELAEQLLPALDLALARRGSRDGKIATEWGMGLLGPMVAGRLGSTDEQQATIQKATEAFDANDYAKGVADLRPLLASGDPAIRSKASLLLGKMLHMLGQTEEALGLTYSAARTMSDGGKFMAYHSASQLHRSMRNFKAAIDDAQAAIELGRKLRAAGATELELGPAFFALAVAEKNEGKLEDALLHMQESLAERPDHAPTRLAVAGYLALNGRREEAERAFAEVPKPDENDRFGYTNYAFNAAWFHALSDQKDQVLQWMEAALTRLPAQSHEYFSSEADLDRYRSDPAFKALMARFRP